MKSLPRRSSHGVSRHLCVGAFIDRPLFREKREKERGRVSETRAPKCKAIASHRTQPTIRTRQSVPHHHSSPNTDVDMPAMHGHEPFTSLTDTVSNVIWKSKCILQLIGPLPLSVHGHPPNPTMAKNGLLSLLRLHPISLSVALSVFAYNAHRRSHCLHLPPIW